MLFFRSYFFKGSETDLNKLVQKQLALNSTITILEKLQPIADHLPKQPPPIKRLLSSKIFIFKYNISIL